MATEEEIKMQAAVKDEAPEVEAVVMEEVEGGEGEAAPVGDGGEADAEAVTETVAEAVAEAEAADGGGETSEAVGKKRAREAGPVKLGFKSFDDGQVAVQYFHALLTSYAPNQDLNEVRSTVIAVEHRILPFLLTCRA